MKFAYADPPYLGCSKHYPEHPEAAKWDDPEAHGELMRDLERDYPDGWALSLSAPSAFVLLALCPARPPRARLCGWFKPFASFKPNVPVAFAWEPVIVVGGRKRGRDEDTVRDWVSANITLERGTHGAKPDKFCFALFDWLGMERKDEFVDLFPGSGAVTRAHESWKLQGNLFAHGFTDRSL